MEITLEYLIFRYVLSFCLYLCPTLYCWHLQLAQIFEDLMTERKAVYWFNTNILRIINESISVFTIKQITLIDF